MVILKIIIVRLQPSIHLNKHFSEKINLLLLDFFPSVSEVCIFVWLMGTKIAEFEMLDLIVFCGRLQDSRVDHSSV